MNPGISGFSNNPIRLADPTGKQPHDAIKQEPSGGFLDYLGWGPWERYERGLAGGIALGDYYPPWERTLPPRLSLRTGVWSSDAQPLLGMRSIIHGYSGADTYGFQLDLQLAKFEKIPDIRKPPEPVASGLHIIDYPRHNLEPIPPSQTFGFDASLGASAGITLTNDKFDANIGAGATFALSTRTRERYLRAGISPGFSLGFRVHNSDDNANLRREVGLGVDVGFVTYDFKTEGGLASLPWILFYPGGPPTFMFFEALWDDVKAAMSRSR